MKTYTEPSNHKKTNHSDKLAATMITNKMHERGNPVQNLRNKIVRNLSTQTNVRLSLQTPNSILCISIIEGFGLPNLQLFDSMYPRKCKIRLTNPMFDPAHPGNCKIPITNPTKWIGHVRPTNSLGSATNPVQCCASRKQRT